MAYLKNLFARSTLIWVTAIYYTTILAGLFTCQMRKGHKSDLGVQEASEVRVLPDRMIDWCALKRVFGILNDQNVIRNVTQ